MGHSLTQRVVARFAAVLFAASGLISLLNHPLPKLDGMDAAGIVFVSGASLGLAVAIWFAPWDRWPRRRLLAIPVLGIALKGVANHLGGVGPYGYGLHYVLIFCWVGLALPRRTSLWLTPLLAVSYVAPLLAAGSPRSELASLAVVVPICLAVGESVAWVSSRLRRAEGLDAERMQTMSWLVEASGRLSRATRLGALTDLIASLTRELLDGRRAVVLLRGEERALVGVGGCGWPVPPKQLSVEPAAHPELARAMRERRTLWLDEAGSLAAQLDAAALDILPLQGSDTMLGVVLLVPRQAGEPDAFTRRITRTLLAHACLAIERLRATEALVDASLRDELTRLGNRRKARKRLEQLASDDALVLLDLDHFKRVNDTHGHEAGDELLSSLGAFLASSLRHGDEAYRFGGEEFLIVFSGIGDRGCQAAERLREIWNTHTPVTSFSVGGTLHRPGEDAQATLRRADAALYEAKHRGRNQVVWAEAPQRR